MDEASNNGDLSEITDHERLRLKATRAARDVIHKLRAEGKIGEIAYHRIEAALDRADLYATRYKVAG